MGLFGGSSKSAISTVVTTNTTTNIRDIGITGGQAIDLENIIQQGSIEREAIRADSINKVTQEIGSAWNALIGGAGALVQSGKEISAKQAEALPAMLEMVQSGGKLTQMMPYIVIGLGALLIIRGFK